jgi:hypothetical protein
MASTSEDLKSFNQFVKEQLDQGGDDARLSELFDLWMLQNSSDDTYAEDVAAVNASINDFMNGERGTPATLHSQQLRSEFGIGNE